MLNSLDLSHFNFITIWIFS